MNEEIFRCPVCNVIKPVYGTDGLDYRGTCSQACARVAAIVGAIDRLTTVMTPVYTVTDADGVSRLKSGRYPVR